MKQEQKQRAHQAASKSTGSHSHILLKTSPSMTTYTAQYRGQEIQPGVAYFSRRSTHCAKGNGGISLGFSKFSCGRQHLSAANLLSFSGFPSQLFFDSLEAHEESMGFIEEFSQDFRVNIYILSDDMDKGATCHHLWLFCNKTGKTKNLTSQSSSSKHSKILIE